jgi:thienamycin biosynthesis protein ThnN
MVTQDTKLRILRLHTDPTGGAPYWIETFRRLGLTVEQVIDTPLAAGFMDAEALRRRPIEDFIPRRLLARGVRLITSETSGMTGKPIVTVFTESEFQAGFVAGFVARAEQAGFPLRANWLWAGPSGPHVIGKAVREILRSVGGLDPFSIDFDPRWFRKLPGDSVARERYMAHLESQIMDLLDTQRIDVLFSTPPVIRLLAERLSPARRDAIRGVHYGGMSITPDEYDGLKRAFPKAVHLHGYGNSMFGMFTESACGPAGIEYSTASSERIQLDLLAEEGGTFLPCTVGETGRVMLSRFDESMMILNHLERDLATLTPDGILDPHPPNPAVNRKTIY